MPISIVFSRVTGSMTKVTSGQGAKLRPGSPMEENLPRNSSTDFSSGLIAPEVIVLYLSVTIFMLFAGIRLLESRRWVA